MSRSCTSRSSWSLAALIAGSLVLGVALLALALAPPPAANAATGGSGGETTRAGGFEFERRPVISSFRCRKDCPTATSSSRAVMRRTVEPGSLLLLKGRNMDRVATVVFFGGRGTQDDQRVRPRQRRRAWLTVEVGESVKSGRLRVIARDGRRSPVTSAPVIVVDPPPAPEPLLAPEGEQPANALERLIWPLRGGIVTSPFGQRWGRLHAGIDIADDSGTPLRAAAAGTVTIAGWEGGYGNYVCIAHADRGISTCYGHLSRLATSVGAQVRQGELIGSMGCTGSCTGPHVHFETRIGTEPWGEPRDPMGYLPPRSKASTASTGRPMHPNLDFQRL